MELTDPEGGLTTSTRDLDDLTKRIGAWPATVPAPEENDR